jgi:hypothetical protein
LRVQRHKAMKKKTSDAIAILRRFVDADPELKAMVQEARAHRLSRLRTQNARSRSQGR